MTLENKLKDLRNVHEVTYKHSVRTGNYLAMLAKACGKDKEIVQNFREAGYAHDLGKLAIIKFVKSDVNVRNLNKTEMAAFKHTLSLHVVYAESYLKSLSDYKKVYSDAAAYHHCWYNGNGYSAESVRGTKATLSGSAIPEVAQMLAIVDVYDALADKERAYKTAMSDEEIEAIMTKAAEHGQFNPKLFKIFMKDVLPQIKTMPEKAKLVTQFAIEPVKGAMRSTYGNRHTTVLGRRGMLAA